MPMDTERVVINAAESTWSTDLELVSGGMRRVGMPVVTRYPHFLANTKKRV